MPGLDLEHVSSNWKKLQAQLKSGKKADTKEEPTKNGLKRKRDVSDKSKTTPVKKTRLDSRAVKPARRVKMGSSQSKDTTHEEAPPPQSRASLVKDHGVAPADLVAAYGTTTDKASRTYTDDINGSLHKTHKAGKYLALDCEMVGTGPPPHEDNVLARVSLVNFHGEQIYDSYVQAPPGIKVEDYRTFVSGIKPHHMREGYARPFSQVQADVAKLLEGRILVGHALKNDMDVLMLSHPKRDMRDTSRLPKYRVESRGKPPALRNLARQELGLTIQTGEHSSVEDARVAMMLFRKEKAAFEEENKRRFGQSSVPGGKAKKVVVVKAAKGEASLSDEEDDEGAEDEDAVVDSEGEEGERQAVTAPSKKKRKKKKRTKRK